MNQFVKLAISRMEPTSTSAKLRQVMPEIEQKLAAGVRLRDIHEVLVGAGFDLTFQTLKTYLYRSRKKARHVPREEAGLNRSVPSTGCLPHDISDHKKPASSNKSVAGVPVSMKNIERMLKPTPSEQAEKLARYERLAKINRKGAT